MLWLQMAMGSAVSVAVILLILSIGEIWATEHPPHGPSVTSCRRGYTYRGGSLCAPVAIPRNAHLDESGHAWVCDDGYRRREEVCEWSVKAPDLKSSASPQPRGADDQEPSGLPRFATVPGLEIALFGIRKSRAESEVPGFLSAK